MLPRLLLALGNFHRRMLAVYFALIGPAAAYRVSGFLARRLYRLVEPIRTRSEAQCRAALAQRIPPDRIPWIAEQAFVHRIWNLTDLMLADRLLHVGAFGRYGGRIPEAELARLRDAERRHRPIIFVTAYYGPFDLLPVFLGYNGMRTSVVYLPHANASFDAYRRRVRGRSGCEMIPVDRAAERLPARLEAAGRVAIVADHHAERRGLAVRFLGLPTQAMRTVGLLTCRYEAGVVVAGIRRVNEQFRFEIVVADIIDPDDWMSERDPVRYVTDRYLRGLEAIILADPTQYLWAYPRWGQEFARELVDGENATVET